MATIQHTHSFRNEFAATDFTQKCKREKLRFERENNKVTVWCENWDRVRLANNLAVKSVLAYLNA